MSKQIIISLILSLICATASAQIRFSGTDYPPVTERADASTGLQAIYVCHSLQGVAITYTLPSAASAVEWKKFGYMGAAHAEDIDPALLSRNGNEITLTAPEGDTGYAITVAGGTTYYFWLIDLSAHPCDFRALNVAADQDCSSLTLDFDGSAERIIYYGINARSHELNRGITLTYSTLKADESKGTYYQEDTHSDFAFLQPVIHIPAPLCATSVTLEGDRFMEQWGLGRTLTTPQIAPHAVEAITSASQKPHEGADNEQKVEGVELGGSAPVEITFTAAVTDAAIFHEWQMSRDPEFYDISYRNTDLELNYTFNEMGNTYVRFVAANADGSCEYYSDTYTVSVGESALRCPNAFSPDASPGVNDEWKVSYKSIISFECYIFDRWGTKITELHHPSQGWDGKYRGKFVPAGVYYYVIKARGADGREYNLSGDINIVKSNR